MSDQDTTPTAEQIRTARHAGFADSVANFPNDNRQRLTNSFVAQDARRERNITNFHNQVVGDQEG